MRLFLCSLLPSLFPPPSLSRSSLFFPALLSVETALINVGEIYWLSMREKESGRLNGTGLVSDRGLSGMELALLYFFFMMLWSFFFFKGQFALFFIMNSGSQIGFGRVEDAVVTVGGLKTRDLNYFEWRVPNISLWNYVSDFQLVDPSHQKRDE